MGRGAAVDALEGRVVQPIGDVDQFAAQFADGERFQVFIAGEEFIARLAGEHGGDEPGRQLADQVVCQTGPYKQGIERFQTEDDLREQGQQLVYVHDQLMVCGGERPPPPGRIRDPRHLAARPQTCGADRRTDGRGRRSYWNPNLRTASNPQTNRRCDAGLSFPDAGGVPWRSRRATAGRRTVAKLEAFTHAAAVALRTRRKLVDVASEFEQRLDLRGKAEVAVRGRP